jgi:tetratricopeptide (TPR) repeat protein
MAAPSASGGPSTFRGTDFQIDCAVLKTLDLISQQLWHPLKSSTITLEPREVHSESVTRWDIRVGLPIVLVEAKASVSKAELEEFLVRVREAADYEGNIELVFSAANTPLLNSLKRLSELARECGSDSSKFDELVRREDIPNAAFILGTLGVRGQEKLPRLTFDHQPENALNREVDFRSRMLHPENPSRLRNAISSELRESAKHRRQIDVASLIESLERGGIALERPTKVELSEIAPEAVRALAALQAVPSGLPEEVVADVTGADPTRLQAMLTGINWISTEEGVWLIRSLPFRIRVPDPVDLACRTLDSLLHFLSRHETDSRADGQLKNAILLAKSCLHARPELTLPLFQATEHIVKNIGDKHLLLEISTLCIEGSRGGIGLNADACARARAQAMLCGTSWVFQRTGRLQEARVWAEKSLKLGEAIGWDRNTAFSSKCTGRLERMEAEQAGVPMEDSADLLRRSADKLLHAIQTFSNSQEFGPSHRQVGDCYSLLARTYLTARDRFKAEDALRKAYTILTPDSPKEFCDLLILNGDYEVLWGSREQADGHYSEVVDSLARVSREHSEIYARALTKRAKNRHKLNRKKVALSDFERAVAIWRELGEHEEAARAEWERIELEGSFESGVLRTFAKENSALIRLSAFQMYRQQIRKSTALAHRARPSEGQVSQYLREARKQVALDYPEW